MPAGKLPGCCGGGSKRLRWLPARSVPPLSFGFASGLACFHDLASHSPCQCQCRRVSQTVHVTYLPRAEMGKWSEATTLKFVHLYCGLRCLWDTNLPEYRHQRTRHEAFQQLVVGMGLENFDTADARVKVKSLRNTYLLELKKIERAHLQNNVYVPAMKWFAVMDNAMRTTKSSIPRGPSSISVSFWYFKLFYVYLKCLF